MGENVKLFISLMAIVVSVISLIISFRTNRHKDNFEIAKSKYFDLLVKDIPQSFGVFENEPSGNLKGESAIEFIDNIDTLRNKIDLIAIIDCKRHKKVIKRIDQVTEDVGKLSRTNVDTSFQQSKEWNNIIRNLNYIVRHLLLTI